MEEETRREIYLFFLCFPPVYLLHCMSICLELDSRNGADIFFISRFSSDSNEKAQEVKNREKVLFFWLVSFLYVIARGWS